jgi:hypothetical protein
MTMGHASMSSSRDGSSYLVPSISISPRRRENPAPLNLWMSSKFIRSWVLMAYLLGDTAKSTPKLLQLHMTFFKR